MNQLFKLKDTFLNYLSPPAKRRRTNGPQTPSNGFATEEHPYEAASDPQDKKSKAALRGKSNQKYLSPSDTKKTSYNPRKRVREDSEEYDPQGDEELAPFELGPGDSSSQFAPGDEANASVTTPPTEGDDEDERSVVDADEAELSAEDKVQEYLDRQAELALRKEAIDEVKARGDWHPDEIYLFERLSMRSFEELLPATWQVDFPTLPEDLFTEDPEKTFINFNCCTSYRGVRALQSLLTLAGRVKDKIDAGMPVEVLTSKEIKNYIKWSEIDGGFAKLRFIPVLTVVAARPKEAITSISKSITDQMEFLAKKHRDALALPPPGRINELGEAELYIRQPPLLYGIIAAQSMAIFVTLDSSNPEAKLRHVAHFDFKEPNMDVWNGFAIAIIVIVARNYMMSVKDELEADDYSSSDPDV